MAGNQRVARLRRALEEPGRVQLGVGPMSRSCVDTVIALANEHRLPLMLIASRRQVEKGGGYVNGWTTETFAQYVRRNDPRGYVLLCRDHGGPWQSYEEVARNMSLSEAVASAKESMAEDLRCGFDIIHIDPSVNHGGDHSPETVVETLQDMYVFCVEDARRLGLDVAFEVGEEEQVSEVHEAGDFELSLTNLERFIRENDLPRPMFVVAQTGALVKETVNKGAFAVATGRSELDALGKQVKELTALAGRHDVWIKEHNADYLPTPVLRDRPGHGVGAINIAPEMGVAETRCILQVCGELGLKHQEELFLIQAYETGKWGKWMLPDSTASDRERAIIAGHYVFGTPEFAEVRGQIDDACSRNSMDLQDRVDDQLRQTLLRYLTSLRLVKGKETADAAN